MREYRSAPREAWATIDETLAMDCNSSWFDPQLKQEIRAAQDAVRVVVHPTAQRIVAEISATWVAGVRQDPKTGERHRRPLAVDFERAIRHNMERGYMLETWKFQSSQLLGQLDTEPPQLNETVIAVFAKVGPEQLTEEECEDVAEFLDSQNVPEAWDGIVKKLLAMAAALKELTPVTE